MSAFSYVAAQKPLSSKLVGTVSTLRQETQAKVLNAMRLSVYRSHTAAYYGRLVGLSREQAAAALKLLEDKGLVSRSKVARRVEWTLTDAGRTAEVK